MRAFLTRGVLIAAEDRAAKVGIGADRALIASGAIEEEAYLRALGDSLGVAFEPLDRVVRAHCPLGDRRLIESATAGLLPLKIDNGLYLAVAPRGLAARNIIAMIEARPALAHLFRFTSTEHLNRFVMRHASATLAAHASSWLHRTWPLLSAVRVRRFANTMPALGFGVATFSAMILAPATATLVCEVMLAALFLAWLVLRLTGTFFCPPKYEHAPRLPDDRLPVYTVIAALYREAASVDGLLSAIERLDYAREKLQVILAVEADDRNTRAAIAARRHRIPITVIPMPPSSPRTKPKALNIALPFARGTFTVVYDAEDRPQPDQLRRALQAFRAGGNLASVQARLCIDNTADSWLAGLFTAEYAGQFDVFLPGLSTLRLPLPLGGSSNHFVTATLRRIGGWDPYNVTEDADLGMRLARFGYRTAMFDSTTYEEAPARVGAWLRQRTRWFKGWITDLAGAYAPAASPVT